MVRPDYEVNIHLIDGQLIAKWNHLPVSEGQSDSYETSVMELVLREAGEAEH